MGVGSRSLNAAASGRKPQQKRHDAAAGFGAVLVILQVNLLGFQGLEKALGFSISHKFESIVMWVALN